VQDAHDAEDVAQAAFLVLARKAASVRWRESVGGWLFPVVYHLALKVRSRRQRLRHREAQLLPPVPPAEPMHELRELLDAELERLPEHYREVVVLCSLEGRTQKEAADLLGLSPGEVRGRLDRARERLRDRLARRGLALSAGAVAALTAPAAAPAMLDLTT